MLLPLLLLAAPQACAPASPGPCPTACAKGSADACRVAAVAAASGVLPKSALAPAFAAVKKECAPADPKSCTLLGLWTELGQGTRADDAAAAKLLEAACDAKDGDACAFLARAPLTSSPEKQLELSARGCEAGSPLACFGQALSVLRGERGATKDEVKATAMFARACEQDVIAACAMAATEYRDGKEIAHDLKKAASFGQKACDAGLVEGCAVVAQCLDTRDPQRPKLLERACAAKIGFACTQLGGHYATGTAVTADRAKALTYYAKGCELGDLEGDGCANHALALMTGQGLKADPVKGAQEAKRACDAGNTGGCDLWAQALATGHGVKKDVAAAKEVMKKKCGEGVDSACNNLRLLEK